MDKTSQNMPNQLTERMVRNEEIFCSLLFDSQNKTLRVVDFRGGNFQSKHEYLEKVLVAERMRKIFTLIERDDMTGWQRVGYRREGAIPGYYKRSDAYIMSRIYDPDFNADEEIGEEAPDNKKFLTDVKTLAKELSESKAPSIRVEQVTELEAIEVIEKEMARRKTKPSTPTKKTKSTKKQDVQTSIIASSNKAFPPVFPQFSREVEYYYFVSQNKRTKQANIIGTEYQDCFGNAKVQVFFSPENKTDQNLTRIGLLEAIDLLLELGAVTVFSLARADDFGSNVLLASAGFRNTGWMGRQYVVDGKAVDCILWTKKLI